MGRSHWATTKLLFCLLDQKAVKKQLTAEQLYEEIMKHEIRNMRCWVVTFDASKNERQSLVSNNTPVFWNDLKIQLNYDVIIPLQERNMFSSSLQSFVY
jgi:hypothetical protein